MKVIIHIAENSNQSYGREAERSEGRTAHTTFIHLLKYIKMMDDKQSACALHSCP